MSNEMQTFDIGQLKSYTDKVSEIASLNRMMVPVYLKDLIVGQDLANNLLARAIKEEGKAKARLEEAESIAYLDKAKDYLIEKGIKESSEARKQFVNLDPTVIAAKDNYAAMEALVCLLKGKSNILRQAHDSLKKMTYDDRNGTAFEGY